MDIVEVCMEPGHGMSEATVQAAIMIYLGSRPDVRIWRNNTGKAELRGRMVQFGIPGQADLSGLRAPNGARLEVEVKSDKGRLGPQQAKFGKMITDLGGTFIVARSVGEVIRGLEK